MINSNERYSRQTILQGFGEAAQKQLAKSAVLVVGVGGLGCPALQYLVAAGIGTIGLIDDDTISLSNLHRQILFSTEDIGLLKVDVSYKKLTEMNPEVSIKTYPVKLNTSNIFELLNGYDVVLDGTDNFASRYLINDACALLKKPLVFAAVSGYEGQLAIFNTPDATHICTNYRDIFPIQPNEGEILNCAENGVLGVSAGIIGTMAAAELIKLITKIGKPLINIFRHYNLLTGQQYDMNIMPAKDYKIPETEEEIQKMHYEEVCEVSQNYIEIDIEELESLQNEPSTLIIDVREKHEFPKLSEVKVLQSPMSKFEALLNSELPQQNIVFICQHGIRSVTAAEAFHEKYGNAKKIYSLKGGISKWRNYFLKS